uniref:Uncharacterized protein n=1 Tax=Arundo donax TaxID=35708 RepID=A0A0A9HK24_ARUDO
MQHMASTDLADRSHHQYPITFENYISHLLEVLKYGLSVTYYLNDKQKQLKVTG